MRVFGPLKIVFASLLLLATGGPVVVAQSEDIMRFIRNDQERMRQQRLQQQGPAILRPKPERRILARRPAPRPKPAPAVVVQDTPETPKVAPTAFVAMLGDSLGELVGLGLVAELASRPEVAVLKKAKGSSGLVRDDFHDWPKAVAELLAGQETITVAVMLIGSNDRQPIREGALSHEPGSERWKELYQERVRAIVRAFAEKRVPLIWVGLPPMQQPRYAADMLALNDLYRAEVQKGGGRWVEIWEAFVDAQGKFTSHGPDVSGQPARLRTSDGIHFTKAGAQKAAHFIEVALKQIIEKPDAAPAIALPTEGLPPQPVAVAPPPVHLPETPEVPPAPPPPRPLAGPIQSLAQADAAPGGVLAASPPPRTPGDTLADQVFLAGRPPPPKPGRADDHRWPQP